MRRYSLFYFIGQSIKGLWHNGVMSLASIMVLMSCLVVMGSFALLVLNLNLNLNNLDVLNEITVFVDTTIQSESDSETQQDNSVSDITAMPELDATSASGAAVLDFEQQVIMLENFTDITQANRTAADIREQLPVVQTAIDSLTEPEERANQQLYLNKIITDLDKLTHRINQIMEIEIEINTLPNVVSTVFNSKAAALENMEAKFVDYQFLFNNLRRNPLKDQFIVTYNDNSKVNTLKYQLETMNPMMYKVNVYTDVARDIDNIKQGVILIFTWFLAILFVVSVAIIINTIKLAVFARRQEISIMRYVGATNWFIILPFIFEGVFIGLLASLLAYFFQFYMYVYVQSMMLETFQMISVIMWNDINILVLVGFITVGMITGIIGSSVSLRKYLSV